MKREQNIMIASQGRQIHAGGVSSSRPMVNPNLLTRLQHKEAVLEETHIAVLGLSVFDIKRLEEAGIFNLKQLAAWPDANILNIPHFGTIKVRRLKADLESYITGILKEQNQEFEQLAGMPYTGTSKNEEADLETIHAFSRLNSESEMAAFSKSLEKLKKRLESLESRFAKARMKINKRKPVCADTFATR
jgi:hypothetical protein